MQPYQRLLKFRVVLAARQNLGEALNSEYRVGMAVCIIKKLLHSVSLFFLQPVQLLRLPVITHTITNSEHRI